MLKSLFTFPYYHTKIPGSLYNKKELIETMLSNYQKEASRNKWNPHCDLHHQYGDKNNKNFIEINYDQLTPIYDRVVGQFIDQMKYNKKIKWSYEIVNYTITRGAQNMWPHHHIPSTFTAVHYLKFNPEHHQSSIFLNPSNFRNIFHVQYNNFMKCLSTKDENNMWAFGHRTVDVEEDDIVITPAIIEHAIGKSNSDEERITIVLDINIFEDNEVKQNYNPEQIWVY